MAEGNGYGKRSICAKGLGCATGVSNDFDFCQSREGVGQFKAGGLIMRQASEGVRDTAIYQAARQATVSTLSATHIWNEATAAEHAGAEWQA